MHFIPTMPDSRRSKQAKDYLALALDNVASLDDIRKLIGATRGHIGIFKVGLEQFTRFGLDSLKPAKESGAKIFLDLKLHDIPNTVAKAVGSVSSLGVDYLTIHTQGGMDMMKAAAKAAADARAQGLKAPKVIGVTVLTSISAEALRDELGVGAPLIDHVRRCASMAVAAGLDGIVCSAADLPRLRGELPNGFEVITPGIRFEGGAAHDQKRVATPEEAIRSGATVLVVGRAVTAAKNPGEAAREMAKMIEGAIN